MLSASKSLDVSNSGLQPMMNDESGSPTVRDADIEVDLLGSLSADERGIIARALLGVDIMEVYSPERVTGLCAKFGLQSGAALDLTNGYDFDLEADRKRCWKIVKEDKPYMLIGSPPCTLFSLLLELTKARFKDDPVWMAKFKFALEKTQRHAECCTCLYRHTL